LGKLTKLEKLWFENVALSKLDLSRNTRLKSVWCRGCGPKKLVKAAAPKIEDGSACWEKEEAAYDLRIPANMTLVAGKTVLYKP